MVLFRERRRVVDRRQLGSGQRYTVRGRLTEDVIEVDSGVNTGQPIRVGTSNLRLPGITAVTPHGNPILVLLFLIAVDGIDQIVRKVVPKGQLIVDDVAAGEKLAATQVTIVIHPRQAGALRKTRIRWIELNFHGDEMSPCVRARSG